MAATSVFFVHLRRPVSRSKNPNEQRDDPFYEFGSFGSTKCHSKNILHPRHSADLEGARLAFIQGGRSGSRLVFLTPPIRVTVWRECCEVKWTPRSMPFRYEKAPILVSNDGHSDFPLIERMVSRARSATLEGGLASLFRSRAQPLPFELASEVIKVYDGLRARAPRSALASNYADALPWAPPRIDQDREATYLLLVAQLQGELDDMKGMERSCNSSRRGKVRSDCRRTRCM